MDGSDGTASNSIICSTSKKSDVDQICLVLIYINLFIFLEELITEYINNLMLFSFWEKRLLESGWMCWHSLSVLLFVQFCPWETT